MPTSRREFLTACSAATGAAILSETLLAENSKSAETVAEINFPTVPEEVGAPYAGWKEGEMDLHFILTGVGESMFHIYPDGTSMLLDAADRNIARYAKNVPAFPDDSRLASEWIMRYLERVNPRGKLIDFMMLSHFHEDHGGGNNVHAGRTSGRGEDYFLSGLANIGEHFTFTKVFDRGYPAYDQPVVLKADGYENFVKFSKYMRSAGKFQMEEFEVGRKNQISLCRAAEKFPTFSTRNICRNGVMWTGEEGKNRNFYAENPDNLKGWVNENSMSLGLLIEYGPFRYFTGGDLSGSVKSKDGETVNLETYVGQVMGPIDVCKTNHHSYRDAMPDGFTKAVQAKVYVSNVWDLYHLQDNTMTSMAAGAEDVLVCPTISHRMALEQYRDCPWMRNLAPEAREGGHVVVKVFDGGRQFKVYYLTASDESMTVRKVYGPFKSKRA